MEGHERLTAMRGFSLMGQVSAPTFTGVACSFQMLTWYCVISWATLTCKVLAGCPCLQCPRQSRPPVCCCGLPHARVPCSAVAFP